MAKNKQSADSSKERASSKSDTWLYAALAFVVACCLALLFTVTTNNSQSNQPSNSQAEKIAEVTDSLSSDQSANISSLEEAISSTSDKVIRRELRKNLISDLAAVGEFDKAATQIEQIVSEDGGHTFDTAFIGAEALAQKGDYLEASELYTLAAELLRQDEQNTNESMLAYLEEQAFLAEKQAYEQ